MLIGSPIILLSPYLFSSFQAPCLKLYLLSQDSITTTVCKHLLLYSTLFHPHPFAVFFDLFSHSSLFCLSSFILFQVCFSFFVSYQNFKDFTSKTMEVTNSTYYIPYFCLSIYFSLHSKRSFAVL